MTDIRSRLADALGRSDMTGILLPRDAHELAAQLLSLPGIAITEVEIEGDNDPYCSWQEDMTHLAAVDRISYGEWLRREVMAAAVQAQEKQ